MISILVLVTVTELTASNDTPYITEILPNSSLTVVRPFVIFDVEALIQSFKRWESFPPCKCEQCGAPVDLVL